MFGLIFVQVAADSSSGDFPTIPILFFMYAKVVVEKIAVRAMILM